MSSGRAIGAGGAWLLLAQVGGLVAQFIYTAITARLMDPADFAIYAIAIIIANLVAIFSVAGLGQSVARLETLDKPLLRSLSTISFVVGIFAMVVIVIPAPLWAGLWRNSEATPAIALVGATAFFAPAVGLISGYMRRVGRFRTLAIVQLVSTVLSFGVSLLMVLIWRSPLALVAAAVLLQWFSLIGLSIATRARMLPGKLDWAKSAPHLAFSWRVTAANIMSFALENVPRLLVSRYSGPTPLGLWNRADVVATVPFDRVNTALSQALYPEYRHDLLTTDRISRRWPDMLAVAAWMSVPASALVAGAAPALVPFLLGEGWVASVPFVTVLALASAGRGVSMQLASALEAIGRFRWIWISQSVLLAALFPVVALMVITADVWIAISFALIFPILRHVIQLVFCFRERLFSPRAILEAYWQPIFAGVLLFCGARAVTIAVASCGVWAQIGCLAVFFGSVLLVAWLLRGRLSAWTLLTRYISKK